jgi:hypothetical protein
LKNFGKYFAKPFGKPFAGSEKFLGGLLRILKDLLGNLLKIFGQLLGKPFEDLKTFWENIQDPWKGSWKTFLFLRSTKTLG